MAGHRPGQSANTGFVLVAELSRRIGDYDEAKQYFTVLSNQVRIHLPEPTRQIPHCAGEEILELAIEQGL